MQNSYSLLARDDEQGVLEVCARDGIGYSPFSPLAGGWLTGKYRRGEQPPAGSRMTLRPGPYAHLERDEVFDALEAFERRAAERGDDAGCARDRVAARAAAGHGRRDRAAPARSTSSPRSTRVALELSPVERDELAELFP